MKFSFLTSPDMFHIISLTKQHQTSFHVLPQIRPQQPAPRAHQEILWSEKWARNHFHTNEAGG
jgi:hypothetical protein